MPSLSEIFGATTAPKPKLSFGDIFAPPQPSVPFVNQPTFEPLDPVQLDPSMNPLNPNRIAAPEGPAKPFPDTFQLPQSSLTPTAISDYNDRKRAEEERQRAEQQRLLEEAFSPAEPTDPVGQYQKLKRRTDYYSSLPYPITADVQSDPATFEKFRRLNELATGGPLLDVPTDRRDAAQQAINNTLANMKANGIDDPMRYLMEAESADGPQSFVGRNLAAAWDSTKRTAGNVFDAMVDPLGNDTLATRQRQMQAGWREGVEDIKDERSSLPNAVNEIARAASQSAPQLAAAAGVGAVTKNPALAWATMLGPSGVENFQVGRTNGLSNTEAAGRAVALAGVEYATAKMGGKVAEKFGMKTFEELAFGGGKAGAKGVLNPMASALGGSIIEGGEEVAAGVAQQFADFTVGLEDELVGDETPEQLALAFAVGMVASGAMHLTSFSNFIKNPTPENAKAIGVTKELAPTKVDRESLAAAAAAKITGQDQAGADFAKQAWDEVNSTAEAPVVEDQPVAEEQVPEPVAPVAETPPVVPVEPAPQPKRRLGDKKAAPNVSTLTGRDIPSPPQVTGGGDRKTANQVRSQLQWLLDQGIAEAESRGDDFNLSWMRNEKVGSLAKGSGLPQATIDSLNEYLFGETNPSWDSRTGERISSGQELSSPPPVLPPITRPISAPPTESGQSPATSGQPEYGSPEWADQISQAMDELGSPPTPSVAPPDAPPVATSQAPADSGVARGTGARRGTKEGIARWETAQQQLRDVINNPDIVGKDRADRIGYGKQLVAFMQSMIGRDLDTGYLGGKEVAYTGVINDDGFREFIYLDGPNAGKYGVTATEAEKQANTERNQREWKEQQEGFKRLREKQQPAPAEPPAPKKKLGQKRTPPPVIKAADLKQKLREVATTPDEGDALYTIVEARAKAAGESVDDYVAKRFADVLKANRSESVYLKQLASGKPDALAQAARSDTHHLANDNFKRWAGTDNVVLHANADMDLEVVYDGALDTYQILDHTHNEQVGDSYKTEEEAYKAADQLTRGDKFETGKPVVAKVYHGSPAADFQRFDREKLGANTGARSAKKGFFFAGNPETAGMYTGFGWGADAPETGITVNHEGWKFVEDNLLRGEVIGDIEWKHGADIRQDKPKESVPGLYKAIKETDRLGRLAESQTDKAERSRMLRDAEDIRENFLEKILQTLPNKNQADAWKDAYKVWYDAAYQNPDTSPEKLSKWVNEHPKETKEIVERAAKRAGYESFEYSTRPAHDFGGGGTMPVYVRMKNPLVFDYAGGDYTDKPFSKSIQEGIDGGHDGVILMRTYDGGPIDNIFITFDEKNIKSALGNQGTFKERGSILAQKQGPKPNAEIQFLAEDGRAIIRAFTEGQNFSSLLHELLHVFELDLTDVQRASLDNWLGRGDWTYNGAKPGKTKDGKWNRAAREKFARAGERYFREGKAPTPELEGVFAKFKEWLSSVYKTIKGSPIDVELSPDIRSVLDELFGKQAAPEAKRQTRPVAESIPNDIQVEVEAIKRKTGERVKVKQNARDAYVELDKDAKLYKQLINCLGK